MNNSLNNIDQKTDSYLNDKFFSQERQQEVSANIQQNLAAETSAREQKTRSEKSRKLKNRAAVIGTMLLAASTTAAISKSLDNQQKVIDKQNAPLIEQIQRNVAANEMHQKAETIGAQQTAETAKAEKQAIDAANAENSAEAAATNQAILDANR